MAGKDLTYRVGVDASDAVSGLRKLESAVRSTMNEVGDELDGSATAGDKFAASIDQLAVTMREDFASAAIAAEELQRALKDAGSGLEVGDALSTLQRMGVSFDEVTQDADKFATSLKQLDDVRVEGVKDLDSVAPGLATKLDDVSKSADSSKGALANMIGNSAQDLGELGGIAGSAGVAVGQMAEYFADAVFEGEGLGSVLKNFAAVAGPIAAISGAVALVSAVMGSLNERSAEATKRVEDFGNAMSESADDAVGFSKVIRDNFKSLGDYIADANDPLGAFGTTVDDVGSKIPVIGGFFKEAGVDIFDAMKRAGLSVYDLSRALDKGGTAADQFRVQLAASKEAGLITGEQYNAVSEILDKYADSATEAAKAAGTMNIAQDEANAILGELTTKADPLSKMADTWATLFADMRDGAIDTDAAASSVNKLAEGLGLTREEVIDLAREHLADELSAQADAAADAAEAARDYSIALAGTNDQMLQMSSVFAEMGRRGDALSAIFDLSSSALESASSVRDISEAIGGLKEAAKGIKLSDALDPANLKADKLLDAFDQLRPQIQAKITEAFQTGGPEAAQATADQYVQSIVDALGGKLSPDKVKELLGIGDLDTILKVALDQSTAARVKTELDALTGLRGATPLTASIALALDAGAITPEAAEVLVRAQLGQAGVTLPTDVTPPSPESIAEAGAFVTSFAAGNPATIPLEGDPTQATTDAKGFADGKQPTATIPLEGDPKAAQSKASGFVRDTEALKPIVDVGADIRAAIFTLNLIALLAALAKPTVTIDADTGPAMAGLRFVTGQRVNVPVEAYLADYPTSAEIVARIGRPRVPVDIVVGQSIRITGVRE